MSPSTNIDTQCSQTYVEFTSPQAATAAKRHIEGLQFGESTNQQGRPKISFHSSHMNPFKTLPKDAPQRQGKPYDKYADRQYDKYDKYDKYGTGAGSGPNFNNGPAVNNFQAGGGGGGGYQNNYRGGRGGFNRGGMRGGYNNQNYGNNQSYGNNMGFNNPMGGGFNRGGMGGNMMGGGMGFNNRGGPNMRGRGGMGGNMMGGGPMMGNPMGMAGMMPGMNMMGGGMGGMGKLSRAANERVDAASLSRERHY